MQYQLYNIYIFMIWHIWCYSVSNSEEMVDYRSFYLKSHKWITARHQKKPILPRGAKWRQIPRANIVGSWGGWCVFPCTAVCVSLCARLYRHTKDIHSESSVRPYGYITIELYQRKTRTMLNLPFSIFNITLSFMPSFRQRVESF